MSKAPSKVIGDSSDAGVVEDVGERRSAGGVRDKDAAVAKGNDSFGGIPAEGVAGLHQDEDVDVIEILDSLVVKVEKSEEIACLLLHHFANEDDAPYVEKLNEERG